MTDERGACPVCDCLYSKPGGGVCGECATGEIYHLFEGDDAIGCTYMTDYRDRPSERCGRPRSEHFE